MTSILEYLHLLFSTRFASTSQLRKTHRTFSIFFDVSSPPFYSFVFCSFVLATLFLTASQSFKLPYYTFASFLPCFFFSFLVPLFLPFFLLTSFLSYYLLLFSSFLPSLLFSLSIVCSMFCVV